MRSLIAVSSRALDQSNWHSPATHCVPDRRGRALEMSCSATTGARSVRMTERGLSVTEIERDSKRWWPNCRAPWKPMVTSSPRLPESFGHCRMSDMPRWHPARADPALPAGKPGSSRLPQKSAGHRPDRNRATTPLLPRSVGEARSGWKSGRHFRSHGG
jgi:hypothetical protein